jgi:hypothetical protein
MMLKSVSFFTVVVLMILMGLKVNGKEDESPDYTQYVAEVTSLFVKEMRKEYGFECGASGGRMPYDIEEISVSLIVDKRATVEQARELEVKATERFIQIINAHEKIRPFLREYPFPSSRADVSIAFERPKKRGKPFTDNDVIYVFQAKNRIYYQAENPSNPHVYKDIKDEPYEEALKIVQSNAAKNGTQQQKFL